MSEEPKQDTINPELEARIAALVMGEASDLERDQLNRLIEARPELKSLKAQFESVHGLLLEVGSGESIAENSDWKLPIEKRSEVLAALDGRVIKSSAKPFFVRVREAPALMSASSFRSFATVAVVLCVVGLVGLMALVPDTYSAREFSLTTSAGNADVGEEFADGAVTWGFEFDGYYDDGPASSVAPRFRSAVVASTESTTDSKSALSGIRDSLGSVAPAPTLNYKVDDVLALGESRDGDGSMTAGMGGGGMDGETIGSFRKSLSREPASEAAIEQKYQSVWMSQGLPQESATIPPAPDRFGSDKAVTEKFAFGGGGGVELPSSSSTLPAIKNEAISSGVVTNWDIEEERQSADTPIAGDFAVANGRVAGGEKQIAEQESGKIFSEVETGQGLRLRFDIPSSEPLAETSAPVDSIVDGLTDQPAVDHWDRLSRRRLARIADLAPQLGTVAAKETPSDRFEPLMAGITIDLAKKKQPAKKPVAAGLEEKSVTDEPFSTFSLHVSDVSFKLAQAALARGEWPEAAKIRIEEFVNAFDYGDPMPSQDEKVSCRLEQSIHPFIQQRNLLRVSMRTAAAGRASTTPLRLTLLLDNSGSMERVDRQQTVRRAFGLLTEQLTPIDQVTLISFARQPRLLADKVSGAQSAQLLQLIDELPSEGGTNMEAALQLAFEKAQEQQVDGAQNRIILLTDGAVNLGDANPESLSQMIATIRDAGIAFDAAGISAEGLNDEVLEALTRKGDGRYYLLDTVEDADDGFARQIAGALRPSAKNVKVQVEFNPKRVGRYKLLGFEKHLLKQEDFRNDKVDAAEMAAAEAGVAIYQYEANPNGEGDIGSVSVRFRDLSTGQMIENRWPIPYEADPPRTDQATPSLRIATTAALFAAKLRGEPLGESVDLQTLSKLISELPARDRNAKRVQQLQQMLEQARQVSGN